MAKQSVLKMSEFFLELFSEEIPANLQTNARKNLLQNFKDFFLKKNINFKKEFSFSTPNRLLISFSRIQSEIYQKEEEIRGPKIDASDKALTGFLRSNNLTKSDLFKKETEKGNFYFAKKPGIKIKVADLLNENIPLILDKISWKKSMKWGNFDLYWARPLKSIMAVFNNNLLNFNYYHLKSSDFTYIEKDFEEKIKKFKNSKNYISFFKKKKLLLINIKEKNLLKKNYLKFQVEKILQ